MRRMPSSDRHGDRVGLGFGAVARMRDVHSTRAYSARFFLLVLLFLVPSRHAGAQLAHDAQVAAGSLVRVTRARGGSQVGRFEGASETGVRVRVACDAGCDSVTATAWRDLRRLDVQVSAPGSPRRAAFGAAVGAAATYLVLLGVSAASTCQPGETCGVELATVGPAVVGVGALLGGVIGWTSSRHAWRQMWPRPPS